MFDKSKLSPEQAEQDRRDHAEHEALMHLLVWRKLFSEFEDDPALKYVFKAIGLCSRRPVGRGWRMTAAIFPLAI
jgi:hypothetical protein